MVDSTSKPSKDDSLSPKEEREMRETLRDIFATDFPNPERRECPENAEAKLKALAWLRRFPEAQQIISHLGSCSPCYQEHEEFVRQRKSRQTLYRLAAVAVLVVGVGFWASWRFLTSGGTILPQPAPIVQTPQSQPQTPEPPVQEKQPPEVQVAVLDLTKRGVARGESNNSQGDLVLPIGRLKLSIYLPIGSEEGAYEVRIAGRGHSLKAKCQAAVRDHITVLTVGADTSAFEAGRYVLAIRQVGWGWYRYPLKMK